MAEWDCGPSCAPCSPFSSVYLSFSIHPSLYRSRCLCTQALNSLMGTTDRVMVNTHTLALLQVTASLGGLSILFTPAALAGIAQARPHRERKRESVWVWGWGCA
jgi:hypothetical protein